MSEKNQPHDETQPVRPQGAADQPAPDRPAADRPLPEPPSPAGADLGPRPVAAATEASAPPGGRTRRWRSWARGDQAYGLGALVAAALAGVIIGGIGTATFHAVTDDHGPGDRFGRLGPMGDRDRRGPMFDGPGGPGQLRPTTPPDEDDDDSSIS